MRLTGTRIRVDDLDVRAAMTNRTSLRVGFVVPKYRHSAVDRNRLKRRLRELVRLRLLPAWRRSGDLTQRADILIRALPSTYRVTMAELAARIDQLSVLLGRHFAAHEVE